MNPNGGLRWISYHGTFEFYDNNVAFFGREQHLVQLPDPNNVSAEPSTPSSQNRERPVAYGSAVSNVRFREGTISFTLRFDDVDDRTTAEVVLQFDGMKNAEFVVGLGGVRDSFFAVRQWAAPNESDSRSPQTPGWTVLLHGGDRSQFRPEQSYDLRINLTGSRLTLYIDTVEVLSTVLPTTYIGGQFGIICRSHSIVHYHDVQFCSEAPVAFVVMQFNATELDDLYGDVIQPTCQELGVAPYRADETFEPGIVISDIQRRIAECSVVIAEVTSLNPNVYYEVGFADALKKPIILLANKTLGERPFDIRPYRLIQYDNTIGGKRRVEESLRRYLTALFPQP